MAGTSLRLFPVARDVLAKTTVLDKANWDNR
jgi:hypothetical protein